MATRGRGRGSGGAKKGKPGVKKAGLKMKDLDAKNARRVRGGGKNKSDGPYLQVILTDGLISG